MDKRNLFKLHWTKQLPMSLHYRLIFILHMACMCSKVESIFVHGTIISQTSISAKPNLSKTEAAVPLEIAEVIPRQGNNDTRPVNMAPAEFLLNDVTRDVYGEEASTLLVLRLAQCRANCLKQFGSDTVESIVKQKKPYSQSTALVQCWTTCHRLEQEYEDANLRNLNDSISSNSTNCVSKIEFFICASMLISSMHLHSDTLI